MPQPTGSDSIYRTQWGQTIHESIQNVGDFLFNYKYGYYDITAERHDIIFQTWMCAEPEQVGLHNAYICLNNILLFVSDSNVIRKSSICEIVTRTVMVVSVAAALVSVENPTIDCDKMLNVRHARIRSATLLQHFNAVMPHIHTRASLISTQQNDYTIAVVDFVACKSQH